jgi:hypothetical protein
MRLQDFSRVTRGCARACTGATSAALAKRLAATAALAVALAGTDAHAALLATYRLDGGAGLSGTSIPPFTGVSIGTAFEQGVIGVVGCLGCSSFLPLGTAQHLDTDFTPENSPEFDTFVAHLNNGVDELLYFARKLIVSSNMVFGPIFHWPI